MTDFPQTLPAEWAAQDAVMLTWPHGHGDWAPWLEQVEPVFVDIARHVCRFERLLVVYYDDQHRQRIEQLLHAAGADLGRVTLVPSRSNDTWARDHGPITVYRDGQPRLLNFTFNGWGSKHAATLDNDITGNIHAQGVFGGTPLDNIEMVLEGGGIELDGQGTLLTTELCLLTPTRNPEMNRASIEQRLGELFGLNRVLWLKHGYLAGDDTDSHIDTLARFCDAETIAYVGCDDPADEHYPALKAMEQELQAFRTAAGAAYRLVELPWPGAKYDDEGTRLPASYANFLIINGAVLVPTYDDPADEECLARLRPCFPDREVIGVPCLPLIYQYGSLHCVTMQLPKGTLPASIG